MLSIMQNIMQVKTLCWSKNNSNNNHYFRFTDRGRTRQWCKPAGKKYSTSKPINQELTATKYTCKCVVTTSQTTCSYTFTTVAIMSHLSRTNSQRNPIRHYGSAISDTVPFLTFCIHSWIWTRLRIYDIFLVSVCCCYVCFLCSTVSPW